MLRRNAFCISVLLLLPAALLRADDTVVGRMYGNAAHAYFNQDYTQAYTWLSEAIRMGTTDPRMHYLRGLCLLRLGRQDEAKSDFEIGAALETADSTRIYNVPRALERVQGQDRVVLEQFRANARLAALQREAALRKQRYEESRVQQERVLRSQVEEIPTGPKSAESKPVEKGAADAFKTVEEPKKVAAQPEATEAQVMPAAAKPAEAAPEETAKDTKPAEAAPKAEETAASQAPAAKEKAETPAAAPAAGDDPFTEKGAKKPAAETTAADPFTAAPAEKPKEKAAAPAAGEDPFGGGPAPAQPAKKSAAPAKAAKGKPAATPAGDDPFK